MTHPAQAEHPAQRTAPGLRVMVLAGARRGGADDPLAQTEGVASKAVIDICGQPMLARVLAALAGSRAAGAPVGVVGLDGDGLRAAAGGHPCQPIEAQGAGPASSLLAALGDGIAQPVLVTTCDHALLTPDMIDVFLQKSLESGADLTVGLAERATIERAYPATRRTYMRLGGAELSGCNLFYLAGPRALNVLRFWQGAEQDRKKPWRIAWRFGPLTALRILMARSGPEAVFAMLSRRLGARVSPVILPFAEAAVDVDKPADLILVREILKNAD
jgi:GTP:adenosylcobinamide-phosphate guanylyltransferase